MLTAAKVFGARGFGVEIKDELVKKSNEAAKNEGLADRVKFMKQDLFKTDMSQATVITMYLLPDTVNLLKDKFLAELKPGTRIVSHDYPLTGWIPEKYVQMDLEDKVQISGVTTTLIYLYVVPAKVAGKLERADAAGGQQAAGHAVAAPAAHPRLAAACASTARTCRSRTSSCAATASASSSPAAGASSAARSRASSIEGTVDAAQDAVERDARRMKLRIDRRAGVSLEVVLNDTPTRRRCSRRCRSSRARRPGAKRSTSPPR